METVELQLLRRLIDDGDVEGVRVLLQGSPSLVRQSFDDGSMPLHAAAERDEPEIVEMLAAAGAPLDSKFGKSAHTALSWALTVEALRAAHAIVRAGQEPDLFCAAGLGLLDRVRAFWDGGRVRQQPSQTGSSRYGADGERLPSPPPRDADQVSDALYIACRLGQLEVSRWLLDRGADPNWRGFAGATCLAWAEFSGNADLCGLLRAHGGSDDVLDREFKATPRVFGVMVFAGWGFPKRLGERLSRDRSLVNAESGIGTPLHAAAASGQKPCVQGLLALGADRARRNASGQTAADVAAAGGHAEVVELLRG
jgi:ankyrin repeat protein